jgi:CheY-like chemotaxis protein
LETNGEEALQLLHAMHPDLIIADLETPILAVWVWLSGFSFTMPDLKMFLLFWFQAFRTWRTRPDE